ncbi:MAG: MGH1-like glycoside hydrolase domain-containing protein [Thermoanaerobaculia bacterium]
MSNPERARLSDAAPWRNWGPYLADRAWATVREDYSEDADPWRHFPHDHARSRAYRWGEDGIAGFCDRYQILCWAMAFWNERDPILKERLFGLVPTEGNHGEDVKECYFYVDALPSHAYQRMLYKYPQRAFPYAQLIEENRRGTHEAEVELIDTGIFDDDRYFDIEIEIAKEDPETLVFRVTAHNRGPERAPIHVIPNLWFRNTWAWTNREGIPDIREENGALLADDSHAPPLHGLSRETRVGPRVFEAPGTKLFTNNETNAERIWGSASRTRYVKDAFHRRIVSDERDATTDHGTKACAWMRYDIEPGEGATMLMRLRPDDGRPQASDAELNAIVDRRRGEADAFYESIHSPHATREEKNIQRQAFAGMLWSRQSYLFDVDVWLDGDDPAHPPPAHRHRGRNRHWRHLNSMRILSMPDKWEYPWFAGWDLAFHSVVFALIDPEFAKEQLWLMLFEQFQHPNGQIPAYEWEFSDLNPPVLAWAVWRVYNMDRIRHETADVAFLEKCFHKLLLNFTWWVNKVDREGNNVFEGGFLGLDNIAVFDRSKPLPGGAVLEQSDATGWMGMFSLVMMRIALELSKTNATYEGLATKFFEHYVYIGAAMKMLHGNRRLWDEDDGFFYDVLRWPDGTTVPFRVRSLVGLIPLYAVERLEGKWIEPFALFKTNLDWFLRFRQDLVEHCVTTVERGDDFTHVLAVVDQDQLRKLLARVVDPDEFLSPFGLRSMSRFHERHPFVFDGASVGYEPAEATGFLKGGNSNWRGPVWFPTTFLMIETLRKLEKGFGDAALHGVASTLAEGMIAIFTPDADGYRPLNGPRGTRKAELFAHDPHWRDLVLFHEYFHAETGEGLGASHQTGWTGLVANLIDEWRRPHKP